MFNFLSSEGSQFNEKADEVEQYRARHRRIHRGQGPDTAPNPQVEDLDVEDGRTRKVSAKWRRQQQREVPVSNQFLDNAKMHVPLNAFDIVASPEAFQETQNDQERTAAPLACQQANDAMENHSTLWERRLSDRQNAEGSTRQLPTLEEEALWGGRVNFATHDAQRQMLYYQPQYFA